MTKIKFLIAFSFIAITLKAQILLQDGEGYSNIVVGSSLLNLDLTNKVATFDYIKDNSDNNNEGFVYGVQLKANIVNGAGVIFSNEKIASNSNIEFLLGYSFTAGIKNRTKKLYELLLPLESERIELIALRDKTNKLISQLTQKQISENELIEIIKNNGSIPKNKIIKIKFLNSHKKNLTTKYKSLILEMAKKVSKETDPDKKKQLKKTNSIIINNAENYYKEVIDFLNAMIRIRKEINNINTVYDNFENTIENRSSNHLFFLRSGYNGSSFKYDENSEEVTIDNRFRDIQFNGWNAEIGYNFNKKLTYFGVSVRTGYENNLNGLSETEYTLKIANGMITDGEFSTSQTIKAFTGNFDRFQRHSLNLDIAQIIPIDVSQNLYMSLYSFLRQNYYDSSETIKSHTQLGIGGNFINSKKGTLLGGVFIQTQDLFGMNSGQDSTLGNRIIFGVLAKVSFKATSVRN